MAAPEAVANAQQEAVNRIHATIKKHGTKAMAERVSKLEATPGSMHSVRNNNVTGADLYLATLAQEVADLAEMIADIKQANAPRPRGRPRTTTR